VVNTSAARDSQASSDPRPAELSSFRYQADSSGKPPKENTMHRNHPTPDHEHPGRLPAADAAAMAAPAPGPADLVPKRQLEKSVSWSGRERLRYLWYRLRLTVAEMNYATRRMVELQAPWISDDRQR
jgi:hypothetical protein